MTGPLSGWIALLLVPLTGIVAWVLHRFVRGGFVRRMRPHFVLGYAALAVAFVHMWTSMGGMQGANTTGIWLGTLALLALGLQALIGANLQSPGAYRLPLRRWHLLTFAAVAAFALGHVAFNSPLASQLARGVGNATVVEHPVGLPLRIAQQRFGVFEKAPFAAHAMHCVRRGKVGAGSAPARVAEQTNHAPLVGFDLRGALVHQRDGLVSAQLSQ